FNRSRSFRLIRSSILVLLPATRPERGQFYFAETGHYHFAATPLPSRLRLSGRPDKIEVNVTRHAKESPMHPALLTRPPEDLGHMARHMMQIMDRLLKSGFSPGARAPDWTPAVDITELADRYEITVELAGVRREDIEVSTENRQLIVSGCRADPSPHPKVRVYQMEIEQGRFRRRLLLPDDADAESISARCRDGLLRIQIQKHGK
ncbi:MAG: Hsp20/alpha crystallin family protein, partial [Phycisphaerae bacterium]